MKDTDRNQDNSAEQVNRGTDSRKPARKRRGKITIPGGAGAAGQIPIKGDEKKRKDDPLAPDIPDQAAD